MLLSHPEIAAKINGDCVPVWVNSVEGKKFHNCEKSTEERIFATSQEAYSTMNIVSYFLTPDLKVVHYLSGYYAPDVFMAVLKAVDSLKNLTGDLESFREAHKGLAHVCRDAADEMEKGILEKKKLDVVLRNFMKFRYGHKHNHTSECVDHLIEAMDYWSEVHLDFSKAKELPEYSLLRERYKFGNGFGERPEEDRKESKRRRPEWGQ